jgi:hypothetical protein
MTGQGQGPDLQQSGVRDRVRQMNEIAGGALARMRNTMGSLTACPDGAPEALQPAPPEPSLQQELAQLRLALSDIASVAVQLQDEVGHTA